MDLLKVARTHVGATVMGVVLLGGGVATAAVVVTPAASTDEVFDAPAATEPAATTDVPAPVATPEPPVAPVEEPEAATVEGVTEPETAPVAPALAEPPADPTPYDPEASWVDQSGQTYIPAPERTFEKLPGEPGYIPPAG